MDSADDINCMKIPYLWFIFAVALGCNDSSAPVTDAVPDTFSVQQPDSMTDSVAVEDIGPQCSTPTPFYAEWLDQCCECLVGTHCSSGACNADCTCAEPGQSCSLCTGATPICVEEDGQFVACVGCVTSDDCSDPDATCIENSCSSPPPTPPEIDGIPVTCQAGECWGTNGKCNGESVTCKGGAQCLTLDVLFDGSPPDNIADPGGHCACQPTPGALPGTESGTCPEGLLCGAGPLTLLVGLLDGSIDVPTHCYLDK